MGSAARRPARGGPGHAATTQRCGVKSMPVSREERVDRQALILEAVLVLP
jgi:hypothetical protein